MKCQTSILLSVSGLLLVVLVSACKPEARNSPAQATVASPSQPVPTATMVNIDRDMSVDYRPANSHKIYQELFHLYQRRR